MADIPIDAIPRRVQFTGNTGLGPFAFTFNILAAADIAVYKNATLLTITTDYTVSVNANGTGSVTLTGSGSGTALVAADYLTIIGDLPLARTTDFTTAGDLLASALNDQLDASVVMTQQISERVDRALRQDPNDVDGDMTIPEKTARLGKMLRFNATTGNPEAVSEADILGSGAFNVYNFVGNGSTTAFTLGAAPGVENNTQVYIDGVYQQKNTYTVSGTTLTFSAAPPNLSTIEVMVVTAQPVNTANAASVSFTQAGSTDTRTVQAKLQESISVEDFGAVGDWDYVTETGTDDTAAIQAAINFAELTTSNHSTILLTAGKSYRTTSVLTISAGISLVAIGGVVGSSAGRFCSIVADHTGDGIIFDGNNGSSRQDGTGCGLSGILVEKGPGQMGGTAIFFGGPDNSNIVGWCSLYNVGVGGTSVSAAGGEGLWARGIEIDGTNQTIGCKNHSWVNVGVTGVSTDNEYVVASSAVQWNWTDGYIRSASASFPSGGTEGMTIRSGLVATGAAPSENIMWTNVLCLGRVVFGEVYHIYMSNCQVQGFLFETYDTGGGSNIYFFGGSFVLGYGGIGSTPVPGAWQYTIHTAEVAMSLHVNNQSITTSHSLTGEDANHLINNDGASADITYTLPDLASSKDYEFDIQCSESAYKINIALNTGDSFYPTNRITSITLSYTDRIICRNVAEGTTQLWFIEILSGTPLFNGLGTVPFDGLNHTLVFDSVMTGDLLSIPLIGRTLVLDPNGASRLITLNNPSYKAGQEITVVNKGPTYGITFDSGGLGSVVAAGTAQDFIYTGSAWLLKS